MPQGRAAGGLIGDVCGGTAGVRGGSAPNPTPSPCSSPRSPAARRKAGCRPKVTSGSLRPRRKSLSTPHTTWMSATLPRAGGTLPARSSLCFHSRTSGSAPGTRYSPAWGRGGAQPRGEHGLTAPTLSPPCPYLGQAARLHLGHTLHHQRGHQGRRRGREVGQDALGRRRRGESSARAMRPRSPAPHHAPARGDPMSPSPRGARRAGEAGVRRARGSAGGTWRAAAPGTGGT